LNSRLLGRSRESGLTRANRLQADTDECFLALCVYLRQRSEKGPIKEESVKKNY
jgi:hypothetical protein